MEPERLLYKWMIEIARDIEHVVHVGHCARDTVVNKTEVVLPLHSQGHTICWRGPVGLQCGTCMQNGS